MFGEKVTSLNARAACGQYHRLNQEEILIVAFHSFEQHEGPHINSQIFQQLMCPTIESGHLQKCGC